MPYSSFIPPVSKKKPTNLSVSFDRIDIVIFLFHVFFFQFWHHFAEKWRHKFGTEFRNLVLQGGWEEERERWERGCKFCFTLEYFKAAVFETTLYKWLLHTLGFTTRTKTLLLHSCPIQVDETWQESCPVQFSRSKNDEFASRGRNEVWIVRKSRAGANSCTRCLFAQPFNWPE